MSPKRKINDVVHERLEDKTRPPQSTLYLNIGNYDECVRGLEESRETEDLNIMFVSLLNCYLESCGFDFTKHIKTMEEIHDLEGFFQGATDKLETSQDVKIPLLDDRNGGTKNVEKANMILGFYRYFTTNISMLYLTKEINGKDIFSHFFDFVSESLESRANFVRYSGVRIFFKTFEGFRQKTYQMLHEKRLSPDTDKSYELIIHGNEEIHRHALAIIHRRLKDEDANIRGLILQETRHTFFQRSLNYETTDEIVNQDKQTEKMLLGLISHISAHDADPGVQEAALGILLDVLKTSVSFEETLGFLDPEEIFPLLFNEDEVIQVQIAQLFILIQLKFTKVTWDYDVEDPTEMQMFGMPNAIREFMMTLFIDSENYIFCDLILEYADMFLFEQPILSKTVLVTQNFMPERRNRKFLSTDDQRFSIIQILELFTEFRHTTESLRDPERFFVKKIYPRTSSIFLNFSEIKKISSSFSVLEIFYDYLVILQEYLQLTYRLLPHFHTDFEDNYFVRLCLETKLCDEEYLNFLKDSKVKLDAKKISYAMWEDFFVAISDLCDEFHEDEIILVLLLQCMSIGFRFVGMRKYEPPKTFDPDKHAEYLGQLLMFNTYSILGYSTIVENLFLTCQVFNGSQVVLDSCARSMMSKTLGSVRGPDFAKYLSCLDEILQRGGNSSNYNIFFHVVGPAMKDLDDSIFQVALSTMTQILGIVELKGSVDESLVKLFQKVLREAWSRNSLEIRSYLIHSAIIANCETPELAHLAVDHMRICLQEIEDQEFPDRSIVCAFVNLLKKKMAFSKSDEEFDNFVKTCQKSEAKEVSQIAFL